MSSFDAETLVRQLAALGRDLQDEVINLGEYEEEAVDAEGKFRRLDALYEDALARSVLKSNQGSAEMRKAEARLQCIEDREAMQDASLEMSRAKAKVRTQSANLSAIHKRCEIGRSLLSRERALLSLTNSGVDV